MLRPRDMHQTASELAQVGPECWRTRQKLSTNRVVDPVCQHSRLTNEMMTRFDPRVPPICGRGHDQRRGQRVRVQGGVLLWRCLIGIYIVSTSQGQPEQAPFCWNVLVCSSQELFPVVSLLCLHADARNSRPWNSIPHMLPVDIFAV